MTIQKLIRHQGVSFFQGNGLVHVWWDQIDPEDMFFRWQQLIEFDLASDLSIIEAEGNRYHAWGALCPLLPLSFVRTYLERDSHSPEEKQDTLHRLKNYESNYRRYLESYGCYHEVCKQKGWFGIPMMLGFYPSFLLGMGKCGRLFTMNMAEYALSILAFSGTNKAYGRDLLKAHRIPVADGALVDTERAALQEAHRIGYPVVLKRVQSGNSEGVIAGIRSDETCLSAARELLGGNSFILIEKMIPGQEYRAHFVNGKLYRIYEGECRYITGDGKTSIDVLIKKDHLDYFEAVRETPLFQKRLVYQLWAEGIRSFADIKTTIPGEGRQIRISPAIAGGEERSRPLTTLHPDDRNRLEDFFARYGYTSAGVDIILPRKESLMADEGGAVIEINAPCGLLYLDNPKEAVAFELEEAVQRDPEFLKMRGRIPVWTIPREVIRDQAQEEAWKILFFEHYPDGTITELTIDSGWTPLLMDRHASALLVFTTECAILEWGMPEGLQPHLLSPVSLEELQRISPLLVATHQHAQGTFKEVRNGKGILKTD